MTSIQIHPYIELSWTQTLYSFSRIQVKTPGCRKKTLTRLSCRAVATLDIFLLTNLNKRGKSAEWSTQLHCKAGWQLVHWQKSRALQVATVYWHTPATGA